MQGGNSSSKLERNAMEKYRRMQMKDLLSRLASVMHTQPSADRQQLPAPYDQATNYIKQLKKKVEELKGRKEQLFKREGCSILPGVEVREMGSCVEVNLISGLNKNFMLYQVLTILEEGGAEVVSASYTTVGDRIFYTIHSKAFISRIGIQTSRVRERLMQLVA